MARDPECGFSNAPGKHRCPLCGRTGMRLRHGKGGPRIRSHFATGPGLCGELCSGGAVPFEERREREKTHPQTCGCAKAKRKAGR